MEPGDFAETFGLEVVLREQSGVLRRDQALRCGFSPAMIDAALRRGRWFRLLPRVYLVGGGPANAAQRVRAAWLWAGYDSVVAGAAAAWWHGIDDSEPTVVDVVVPPVRSMTVQAGIRLIRAVVDPRDVSWRDGIRVTAAARSCLDMVRWGERDLLEDGLRSRQLRVDKLYPSLARSRRRRGQRRARAAVLEVSTNPWSKAERLAHQVFRERGLSGWVANPRTRSADGTVFPDIAFEDVKLAVEIDGRRFHDLSSDAEAWERDHERELALVRAGWTVIRLTYRQLVEQPDKAVAVIREVLERLRSAAAR